MDPALQFALAAAGLVLGMFILFAINDLTDAVRSVRFGLDDIAGQLDPDNDDDDYEGDE